MQKIEPEIFCFEACQELETRDSLAHFRSQFQLPEHTCYLDGNSLGALPKATLPHLCEVIARLSQELIPSNSSFSWIGQPWCTFLAWQVVEVEWGRDLISSWNKHDWWDAQQRIGDKIGRIIGAAPGEVLVADSTSVNLFKVVAAALDIQPGKIIVSGNFVQIP